MNDEHKYDDIIHLPHPVSTRHPQMSLADRAAQFSPFAALTGHGEAIRETERQTEEWTWLDEDRKAMLNERLWMIREHFADGKGKQSLHSEQNLDEFTFVYFQPDERKSGGSYLTVEGRIKKIDEYRHQVILEDGMALDMERLFSIEGKLFEMYD